MKIAMVNSHERSGTHFLMNTLTDNFGYAQNYVDYDMAWNPWVPDNVKKMLLTVANEHSDIVVKSHYEGKFFEKVMDDLTDKIHMFYVYRNYTDTLKSCMKHFNDIPWDEGPKVDCLADMLVTPPYGACIRYQYQQYPNMWLRWENHVESWKGFKDVIYVRYEDLNENFEVEVKKISERIGVDIIGGIPKRPDHSRSIQNGYLNENSGSIAVGGTG